MIIILLLGISFSFIIMEIIGEALAQGIVPAIIVVVYLVIVKIIDTRKENNQNKVSNELVKSISTISNFLNNITRTIISKDRERCRIIIKLAFDNLEKELFLFVRDTIITNNIDKRHEYIVQSLENTINGEYYQVYNYLSVFEIDGHKVSSYCKESWKLELKESLIAIIFDNNLDKVTKITETQTKLNAVINNYSTYVHNKTFNQ